MRVRAQSTSLLGRVLKPLGRCLNEASARQIMALRADSAARRRIETLAAKCDAGRLTPEERAEYQVFVEVGDLVALLQAKARRYLSERSRA